MNGPQTPIIIRVMEKPPVFQLEAFPQAMDRAAKLGKWLIVDTTGAWCQPCQLMDRTTWRDPEVVAWIESNAIALQIDVDEEEALARELVIAAMPTVVVFKDGVEKDRVVGYRNPAGLLDWLRGVERGETAFSQLQRSVTDPDRDMRGRLEIAKALLQARRYEEATREYEWLWENMDQIEPAMGGVRVSFMAGDICRLAGAHEPARLRFTALRDRTGADARGRGDGGSRQIRGYRPLVC